VFQTYATNQYASCISCDALFSCGECWLVVAVFNAINNATTTMVEGFGLEQWCLVLKFGKKNPIVIC
jgi:hypothetical protein